MNVVCVGAHPDDGEVYCGGTCIKWAVLGHRVVMVSMTNGDIGHHEVTGEALAQRRLAEAREAARRGGYESLVFGNHDGELQASLDVRKELVRLLRRERADLVLTHRPYDYHPDHRYTAVAVQDSAFMVMVPHFCPETPRLERNPVFAYMMDRFQSPTPFRPDVAVAVDDVMDRKWDLLDAMPSQVYEWLPWLDGVLDEVPRDPAQRREWLRRSWTPFFERAAVAARGALAKWYDAAFAHKVRFAELFEVCEYGRNPSDDELRNLFPVPSR